MVSLCRIIQNSFLPWATVKLQSGLKACEACLHFCCVELGLPFILILLIIICTAETSIHLNFITLLSSESSISWIYWLLVRHILKKFFRHIFLEENFWAYSRCKKPFIFLWLKISTIDNNFPSEFRRNLSLFFPKCDERCEVVHKHRIELEERRAD